MTPGDRRLTINSVIRKYQIEATRTRALWEDETELHSADVLLRLSETVRAVLPDARITWGFSWCALTDSSDRYATIRRTVRELVATHGDAVSYVPGGFFANRYATRDEVARDIVEALDVLVDGFGAPPAALLAGFLSAENTARAAEHGIRTVQGHAWSQYHVDMQDGDGSIAYPYYPSRRHFLAPGHGADRVDVVTLDGWTVDLLAARRAAPAPNVTGALGSSGSSRMGLGPIETLHRLPLDTAQQVLRTTSEAHLDDRNVTRNGLGYLTTNYEVAEVSRGLALGPGPLAGFGEWLSWLGGRWPDLRCVPMAQLGEEHRGRHTDNSTLVHLLQQVGSGVGYSTAGERVTWFMNGEHRLGVVDGTCRPHVFDYTDYRTPADEPRGADERNWSLLGELNQKGSRPQDVPVPAPEFFAARPDVLASLAHRYLDHPELTELLGDLL